MIYGECTAACARIAGYKYQRGRDREKERRKKVDVDGQTYNVRAERERYTHIDREMQALCCIVLFIV